MVEGESGLLACASDDQRPVFHSSRRLLTWPNGAMARLFSAEDPEALRGPQHDCAWADELAKWRNDRQTWDMLQFGLRLGERPQQVVTTTPRPRTLLKEVLARPDTVVTRARTHDNRANLAAAFFAQVIRTYEGTRLGRQELDGELVEGNPAAFWQPAMVDPYRVAAAPPELARIVVAVDPPASAGPDADECGIVVAGCAADGTGYVLADRTVQGLSPAGWAGRAIAAWRDFEADRLVAEVNQGGDMVRAVLAQVEPTAPLKLVRATRAKTVRAEPVAALYEQGRVHHVGVFTRLEDQMFDFDGEPRSESPDRVDALVWALTELMLGPRAQPAIRAT
jgi:phage terminase large subunit-like protein